MTHDPSKHTPLTHESEPDATLPDALRWKLRALRTDASPGRELWPDIAARIAAQPAITEITTVPAAPVLRPARRRARWIASLATAATLALALGLGWQLRPDSAGETLVVLTPSAIPATPATMIVLQADAMSREYEAALREMAASHGIVSRPIEHQRELTLLDSSATQIRAALALDPDARFLLSRLQHVYAKRLTLTQYLLRA